eukprot:15456640-Alexandrium_andersonii.AAC.1
MMHMRHGMGGSFSRNDTMRWTHAMSFFRSSVVWCAVSNPTMKSRGGARAATGQSQGPSQGPRAARPRK